MRQRPSDLLGAGLIGAAGAIWGLGLARLLADANFWTLLHGSVLAVAGLALACAVIVVLLFFLASNARSFSNAFTPLRSLPLFLPLLYVVGGWASASPLAGAALVIGGAILTLLLIGASSRQAPDCCGEDLPAGVLPTLLGLVTLALYLRTLLPSVGEADTFEFQVVVPLLRVAHPTGYPLYILLGKLFTLLPFSNVAWRVTLSSAVFGTGAVLALYALLRRLTERRLIAFLVALAFAFSFTFWSQAIVAEVYTLHNLLVASILWLLFAALSRAYISESPARHWQITFFLLGLSFTNHLTTALLLPAVALALLWDHLVGGGNQVFRHRPGGATAPVGKKPGFLAAAGFFLLGLSVYLFIPLRWPALNNGEWMTLRDFAAYVTGGQFHGALRLDGWRDPVRWGIVARLLRDPFGWIGLGLASAGVIGLAIRRRRALALTGVTFLAFLLYGLDYYVADVSVFLLPAHLILALWIGVGAKFLIELGAKLHPASNIHVHLALVILLSLLPLSRIWLNLSVVDQSANRGGYAWGRYVLDLPLAEDSAILADVKKFAPLYYLQQVEGVRPDLEIVLLGTEQLYQAELRERLGTGQVVYLARYLPHLESFYLRSVGPLVEVRNSVSAGNRVSGDPLARFGEAIHLFAQHVEVRNQVSGRNLVCVTLDWRAEMPVDGDFVVQLRLVDDVGRARWTGTRKRPVAGLYPTNAWPAGAVISDYHELSVPPWLPPGSYRLEVGLFRLFGSGLGVDGGSREWFPLRTLQIEPPSEPPPLPQRRRYSFSGGTWLIGCDASGETPAGSSFTVDLAWHTDDWTSNRSVERSEVVQLFWRDAAGQTHQRPADIQPETFPLAAGMVRSRHVITAPREPGVYTLRVGLDGRDARCGWLASSRPDCSLVEVKVTPSREGLANFGDRVLLREAEVGKNRGYAGEIIPVTLSWRALRAMDEDHTVFVHLVGPEGRLHGQVDTWPVQGTYPTSQWAPGEDVEDHYEVPLDNDAPSGRYRVEVGWYLLETMQRLQVLDVDGKAMGDSFVVGELDVGGQRP